MDPVAPIDIKFLQDEYSIGAIAKLQQMLWCRRCGRGFGSGVHLRGTFHRTMMCYTHEQMTPKEFRELLT